MSMQTKDKISESISDKDVVAYLKAHPDFFEHNPILLAEIHIPHITGAAVSLVERQVAVLRQKNSALQSQLDDFIQIASDNEKLSQQVYRFTLELIQSETPQQIFQFLHRSLREDFLADEVYLCLYESAGYSGYEGVQIISNESRFQALFDKVLQGERPMVGRFNIQQRQYLFKDLAEEIGSMAVLPLIDSQLLGCLAIGSYDESRFHAGMGTVYLHQMATLIAKVMAAGPC